jgi:hypothetical protein
MMENIGNGGSWNPSAPTPCHHIQTTTAAAVVDDKPDKILLLPSHHHHHHHYRRHRLFVVVRCLLLLSKLRIVYSILRRNPFVVSAWAWGPLRIKIMGRSAHP